MSFTVKSICEMNEVSKLLSNLTSLPFEKIGPSLEGSMCFWGRGFKVSRFCTPRWAVKTSYSSSHNFRVRALGSRGLRFRG